MLKLVFGVGLLVLLSVAQSECACQNDLDVKLEKPLYLQFQGGFFYIHGLTNGEVVVIYKHPDDPRVFGQYSFKNELCKFETIFYFVSNGKFEFTNPYVIDESMFNVTNKLNFNLDKEGYEIVYHMYPRGFGVFHNLKPEAIKNVLKDPIIKKTPAANTRGRAPMFPKLGRQNLKVSYMKNGENYIQFISKKSQFLSIEGQYTLRTSDRKYHSVTYEVPLDDFDFNGVIVNEHEMSAEENYHKSGTLRIDANGTIMDVKYFVNKSGFFVADIEKPLTPTRPPVPAPIPVTLRPQIANSAGDRRARSQQIPRTKRQTPTLTVDEYLLPRSRK